MFGHQRGLIAQHQIAKARQVPLIQRARPADGQAHAVQRQRVVFAQRRQHTVRWTARAHVVLGVHLEKAILRRVRQDRAQVFVLEAGACEHGASPCGRAIRPSSG